MRFALVWLSATITAVIAAERTHNSTYNQSTPFAPLKLICAGEGGKRRRGGQQHPRAQVSRKLLLKGHEDVIGGRSDIHGLYRLKKGVVQKQAKRKDVEAWASTSAAPEHHRVFDRPGQYQRSGAHSGPHSVQHGQLQLGYDDSFLKNLHSSADLFRNAGKHSSMYSPDIEHIRKNWQDKPTLSIAREGTPLEQPESSEAEPDRMQALRDHQRLHADKLQNEMAFQEIRGSGSRQHQKNFPHTSEIEALANYEAYSGQRHPHPESNDMIRAKRAEYRVRSAVQPVTELQTLADVQSQVKGRNQLKNHQPSQQQQREAHNRNTLHTMQDGNPSVLNQRQRAENVLGFSLGYESSPKEDRLPPVRFSFPFSGGRDVHRDSSTSGALSSRQKSTTGRKKSTATKENLSGTTGLHKEKRAERRSYRRGDSLTAAASPVAPRIRGWNALSDGETGRPLPKSVPISALSLTDYEVDVTEELPLMSKSVLDLGIADVQMLADALYALKSAHYAQRLEEASKQRNVQEGMFFTKLNRIQERQKRQRRESERRDEERLKSLEQSLRLTKPLNTYYDTVSEETAHRRKRKSVSENRFHKGSDLDGWNRTTGEVSLGREVKLSRRSPKKEGHWWERRQKQKIALALIEREEHGDEGSARASRYRRHSRRGAEEKDTDDGAPFDIEKGNQGHEARTIFSTWEDLSTTPDGKGDLLFLAEEDDLLVSSQTEVKRDVKPARTEHRGENSLNKGGKEIKEATGEAGGSIRPFDRPKLPAGEGQQRGVDTHLEALSRPAIARHKNYKSAGKAESAAYPEGLTQGQGQAGQRTRQELDTSSLFPAHGDKTLSNVLQIDTVFSPPNVGVAASEEEMATETEILSALVAGDGTEKLLAEKVSGNALHVYQTNRVQKPAGLGGMLRKGSTDATEGMRREHKDSEDEMVEGGSVGAEVDLSALHESHAPTLPPDSRSTNIVRPTSQENNVMEQEAEVKTNVVRPSSHKEDMLEQEAGVMKGEEIDSLEDKQALADENIKRPESQSLTSIKNEGAEETIVQSSTAAAFQSGELIGEGGTLQEEAAEAPVEGEAGSETSSHSVAVAHGSHQPTGVPEEDVLLEESGLEHVLPETLKIDTVDSSAIQPRFRESPSRSDHRVNDPFTFLDTSQDVTEEETSQEESFLKKGSFREEVTLDDTFALRLSESLPPEVLKNDKKPAAFNRPYEYTTGTTYSSPREILPISPSRLSRFRARHFRGDTPGKSEFAGERPDRFNDRSPEIRHGDKVKLAIPVVQELRALPYYRRLQFTSKKRTVLDRSTPARFEFVDNDHGMQFVNWRSIDGERMIEKFWVNSMEEAERQQRRQVQREIESAFAKEFDAVRRRKQISHALGLSTAEDDESEQQLAQRYYSAMQAVLHGPEEEVLTGQAFGRYVPSINRSFLTDIRNRIIYGPWSVNWNRAITSRTQRVSVGSRRGAVSVGSSASSYVTTANVNWGRTAVTFSARPNDQAVKLGVLRGRYGVDIARSNRLRTSAVETVMRYVESATVVDQINRTYGQRVRVRRFSFNYTRDFTLPSFDSPGRTPGLRQELGVNWGTVGISVGTDVPDSEYAVSVGLRGYQFSVLRDFFQRLVQAQGNWGRGWQFELATKVEDPISPLIYYQFGFGRLGRLYSTVGAGIGGDNTPMALFQVQGDRTSVVFKAVEYAGVRAFNVGITVGRFTYSWDSVVSYDQITLPLSPISPILKALLQVTP